MSSGAVHGYPDASFVADAAMTVLYTAVKMDTTNNEVAQATANTDRVLGIIQTKALAAGDTVNVRMAGFSMARCAGGWTRGDKLTPTTGGELEATTTAADLICAIAQDTVSDNEDGEVLLIDPVRYDSL